METMELHVAKMETQLSQWGEKLDQLVAKADVAAVEATLDYHKRVDELKGKYQLARAKLDELKTAESSEKWEIIQAGVESTWNELELALTKLTGSPSSEAP
ncbi:MAG TPA: hypothetical protein VGK73_04575 [Polyangiaceae bacterium]